MRTTALSSHPLLTSSHIVAPALGLPDAAAALVFGAAGSRADRPRLDRCAHIPVGRDG